MIDKPRKPWIAGLLTFVTIVVNMHNLATLIDGQGVDRRNVRGNRQS